jgi:hypothetical protein
MPKSCGDCELCENGQCCIYKRSINHMNKGCKAMFDKILKHPYQVYIKRKNMCKDSFSGFYIYQTVYKRL